jgi:hypothetical protein
MNTTGTIDNSHLADEQASLAALLAMAPPVTPQMRREMDRARTEALKATRLAVGCQISAWAEAERACTGCAHAADRCECPHDCVYEGDVR